MDHWWHTSLSARPHNHYTNTQSPHKQTQTQRNKDKHGHINITASKVFSDQRRLLGQTSPPTTNNRKQYLPFLSHICWENVCLFVYLFVYMFLYISLFVYLFICVFVYFDQDKLRRQEPSLPFLPHICWESATFCLKANVFSVEKELYITGNV